MSNRKAKAAPTEKFGTAPGVVCWPARDNRENATVKRCRQDADRRTGRVACAKARKISFNIHLDAKYLALPPEIISPRGLFHSFLIGPYTTQLPGLIPVGRGALADEFHCDVADVDRCFAPLETAGMARADWSARLVWLPNAIRHNAPANPADVKNWRMPWLRIADCPLKADAYLVLREYAESRGKKYVAAFDWACPMPKPEACE